MKKPLTYEEWVREFLSRLSSYFDLAGWTARVVFSDEEKEKTYAETSIDSSYQHMTIRVYKTAKEDFESGNMATLTRGLVHELVHVFLDPFHMFAGHYLSDVTAPFFADMMENQTQKLTMVFLKNMPAEIFPPRTKHGKHD